MRISSFPVQNTNHSIEVRWQKAADTVRLCSAGRLSEMARWMSLAGRNKESEKDALALLSLSGYAGLDL